MLWTCQTKKEFYFSTLALIPRAKFHLLALDVTFGHGLESPGYKYFICLVEMQDQISLGAAQTKIVDRNNYCMFGLVDMIFLFTIFNHFIFAISVLASRK